MSSRIAELVEHEAENRLEMLESQLSSAEDMRAKMNAFEALNDQCDWDGAIAALGDVIAILKSHIDGIEDWKNDFAEGIATEAAEYRRDRARDEA